MSLRWKETRLFHKEFETLPLIPDILDIILEYIKNNNEKVPVIVPINGDKHYYLVFKHWNDVKVNDIVDTCDSCNKWTKDCKCLRNSR